MAQIDAIDTRFHRILRARDLRTVFQPILHLPSGAVAGYEALVRGPEDSGLTTPASLLAAANRAGRLVEFDWAARASACRAAFEAGLDRSHLLFLNIEPIALDSECPADLWPDIERAFHTYRVVLEVTERSLDRDPGTLLDGIERQRPVVAGIALDDVGSHPATLAMLPLVAPAVIKIDGHVVQGAPDHEVARVLSAVHGQAEQTGAVILAEGVENAEHRRRAVAFGAELGQGDLLGVPGRLPPRGGSRSRSVVTLSRTPPLIVDSPFEALYGRIIGRAGEDLIAALTRYVGAYADATAPALHIKLQPGIDQFDPNDLGRLARLASQGTFAAILGPGIPSEPGHGIRGVGLRRESQPLAEWAAITVSPGFCVAVMARQPPGSDGYWQYGHTQDWTQGIAAARSLVRLLGSPEPRFRFES